MMTMAMVMAMAVMITMTMMALLMVMMVMVMMLWMMTCLHTCVLCMYVRTYSCYLYAFWSSDLSIVRDSS